MMFCLMTVSAKYGSNRIHYVVPWGIPELCSLFLNIQFLYMNGSSLSIRRCKQILLLRCYINRIFVFVLVLLPNNGDWMALWNCS